ncbi:MAG: DUF1343 domain-containing protein [Acidobacteria bacterium]|nr:DUF1343 domain-containing protein [Acidobacteriota bacterium]
MRTAVCRSAVAAAAIGAAVLAGPGLSGQSTPPPRPRPVAAATSAGFDLDRLSRVDEIVDEAIAEKKTPGAVVLVGRDDTIVYRKAFGRRAVAPADEPMTVNTIFDMASLTKVMATTPAIMKLVEEGRVRLIDPVASFIPEFGKYGKSRVTVRDLMTHMSGLRPDVDLGDPWSGYDTAIALACEEVLTAPPGRRFVYSDINYFLLGEIVRRVTKQPLDVFTKATLFGPLKMTETGFNPARALYGRIAPTEPATLRGIVHDPTARRMGGVAGHAGLFSTADDVAIYARMLLNGGAIGSTRVLAPLTVARMIEPSTPLAESNVRGLGWDLDSSFSSNRGELLPLGSYGHTGFTGTSLWIDPATKVFVVFLSNRVHPNGAGDVTPTRARVATAVAAALTNVAASVADARWSRQTFDAPAPAPAPTSAPVMAGIDVLRAQNYAPLKGLRVGLLTNHTGRARDGVSTIDLLAAAPDVKLVALFSPEHGIRGVLDASVPSSVDDKTKLPIHSLYGQTQRPTVNMLAGLDAIVIDLQDVGARFYTYMTTMAYVMEEAAPRKIKVVVLDRPNPINGVQIEGPALDPISLGFTGYFPTMPIRPGMTIGELARLFNTERQIGADLTVVPMQSWRRDQWFDETGLPWINPSPNMRTLYAAALYPGIGALENTNLSVGRGTDTPFEQVGAPWIDGRKLSDVLNSRGVPGVRFYPVRFTPTASRFAKEECQGVFIVVTDRSALRPVRLGVELGSALVALFPGQWQSDAAQKLFGSADSLARLKLGEDPAAIAASWSGVEARWRLLRAKYLLYY